MTAAAPLAAALVWAATWLGGSPRHGPAAAFTLLSGCAFGFVLQRSRFCFASAFRSLFVLGDRRGLLGVIAALAAGSVGYAIVFGAQLPDPTRYLPQTAHVAPLGWHLVLGGVAFGAGMMLAGGCIGTSLYRLGEGSLVAPVTLFGAVGGYLAAFQIWDGVYLRSIAAGPLLWLPREAGYGAALAIQLGALALLAALLLARFPSPTPSAARRLDLRAALRRVFVETWPAQVGGVAIGLIGVAVFFRTTPLGVTAELGRLSHLLGTRLGLAPDQLLGLGELRGCRPVAGSAWPTQNALFVSSLVGGSLFAALLSGEFRLRSGRPRTFFLGLVGGFLLGFGAMISLGCTVGTLLSGIMAQSLSGWLFAAGLFGGAWVGLAIQRRIA